MLRKLVNGNYVPVEVSAPATDADAPREYAEVLDQADIDQMDKGQLVKFLNDNGVRANRNWKEDTLRNKALALAAG